MPDRTIQRALTIAGSDSGGGAGIQADLKTFAAFGVYGMSAITSVTAQNTLTVAGVHDLPPEFVAQQIDLVAQDIGVDAAKTGMLSNAGIVRAVAESVTRNNIQRLVVDPVMVAKSGDALLREDARNALIEAIVPLAYVITPNLPEAAALTGLEVVNRDRMADAAKRIFDMGARHVLVKGGHLEEGEAIDLLFDGSILTWVSAPRIPTSNTHGTGCTYSAAIAACLALGLDVPSAVNQAKRYVTGAIQHALALGSGHGPLDHGWRSRDR
jgi:hydroxymethylpyrimidine/phosphomethylpyrimidine kinase